MFMEDSSVGREVLKEECKTLLSQVAKMIPVVLSDDAAQNGLLCYQTVKVKNLVLKCNCITQLSCIVLNDHFTC